MNTVCRRFAVAASGLLLSSLAVACAPTPATPTTPSVPPTLPPTVPGGAVRRATVTETCSWVRVDAATNVATPMATTQQHRTVTVTAPTSVVAGSAFDVVVAENGRDIPRDAVPEPISAATSYTAYHLAGPFILDGATSHDGGQVHLHGARRSAVVITRWPDAAEQPARTNSLRITVPAGITGQVPLRILPDPVESEVSSAFSIITGRAGHSGSCHLSGPADLGVVKVVVAAPSGG